MAKTLDAVYNPSDKKVFLPIEEGSYPAHITSLTTKELNTRAGEAIVVNMTYKVAPEVLDIKQLLWEMDGYDYLKDSSGDKIPVMNKGKQVSMPCEHMKDRTMYDNGFWVFTDTSSASKNERYFAMLETLNIECEDKDGFKKLMLVEEDDVIGKPVMINVKKQQYVTKETRDLPAHEQEKRTTHKVITLSPWPDGEVLTAEELDDDVPF